MRRRTRTIGRWVWLVVGGALIALPGTASDAADFDWGTFKAYCDQRWNFGVVAQAGKLGPDLAVQVDVAGPVDA